MTGAARYQAWRDRLATIDRAGRTRIVRALRPTGPVTAELGGREVVVACSNDYLGLAWHPEVQRAARGGGAGGSRLISGSRPVHHQLEDAVGERFDGDALIFGSGWHANLAVFSTVCDAGDRVASDALNHASIIDGLRLGRAERVVVPHADPSGVPDDARLVVVEGLFSMDGDVPPLGDYPRAPWLAVDEAHAVGCLGPGGQGAAALHGVRPDIRIGTFGKAYGAAGAFVVGPPELKRLLVNAGRSFIFTTALPEPVAAMATAGLRLADDARRQRLSDRAARLRRDLRGLGWPVIGEHHILPVIVGPSVMALADRLLAAGVFAPPIRWPTVAEGAERIRLTVSSEHDDAHLDRICEAFGPAPR